MVVADKPSWYVAPAGIIKDKDVKTGTIPFAVLELDTTPVPAEIQPF
jgi:hypothetical protein